MEKTPSYSLLEKRPSLTEKELTPIVLNELQNTSKQKEEWRKARRSSAQKQLESQLAAVKTIPAAAGVSGSAGIGAAGSAATTRTGKQDDPVSDSGAESCGEEARQKTAEAFLTGIHTALKQDGRKDVAEAGSEDIVTEVNNVLSKLIASIQKDGGVSGLAIQGNIIPLITSLQSTLTANKAPGSVSFPQIQGLAMSGAGTTLTSARENPPIAFHDESQSNLDTQGSKLPWRIRANKKRQKHLTLGMTREEFANIQEALRDRQVEFYDRIHQQPAPYSLARNKSEGEILKSRNRQQLDSCETDVAPMAPAVMASQYTQGGAFQTRNRDRNNSDENDGYVSDVCDYNLSSAPQASATSSVRPRGFSSIVNPGFSSAMTSSAAAADTKAATANDGDDNSASGGVVQGILSLGVMGSPGSARVATNGETGMQSAAQQAVSTLSETEMDNDTDTGVHTAMLQIKPAGSHMGQHSTGDGQSGGDDRASRQSSVEDSKSSDVGSSQRSRRRSSGGRSTTGSGSAVKSRIQKRRLMKEANRLDVAVGGALSDQDPDQDETESIEEKQDKECIRDFESFGKWSQGSKASQRSAGGVNQVPEINQSLSPNVLMDGGGQNLYQSPGSGKSGVNCPLTPETARRMRDWNSRFSNLKSSFDSNSERDGDGGAAADALAAENDVRDGQGSLTVTRGEERGRSLFRADGRQKRAQSAHNVLLRPSATANAKQAPRMSSEDPTLSENERSTSNLNRSQSKDDKNKSNTIIANHTQQSLINKERSPNMGSVGRRVSSDQKEDSEDEYLQYLNSVDRYRQNNPNPKPFRPVTSRTDAIANSTRKYSDGQSALAHRHSTGQNSYTAVQQQQTQQQQAPSQQPAANNTKQFTPGVESSSNNNSNSGHNNVTKRISKSMPKEVTRTKPGFREESQAEILGLVRTNRETGQIEKTKDMDYDDYMNIINRVRKSKEFTRARTEQARLASMYAQEKKRQEEIAMEEERLRLEKENFDQERKNSFAMIAKGERDIYPVYREESSEAIEKGQLDYKEQEQTLKVSPRISPKKTLPSQERDHVVVQPQVRPETADKNSRASEPASTVKRPSEAVPKPSEVKSDSEARPTEVKMTGRKDPPQQQASNPVQQEAAPQPQKPQQQPSPKQQLESTGQQQQQQQQSPLKAEDLGKEENRVKLEQIQNQQIRQQKIREEQVLAEQRKLEKLREEQIKQEKEREEIRRLELERLKQIQEEQERLEEERRRQEEEIRQEQLRLEEERRKQEVLQKERQEQYQKQEEEMMAKAKAAEAQKLRKMEQLKLEQIRQTSMSPHERLIQERLRQQERIRELQLKEEAQIRQEKLNLIRQEEVLLKRQEEMLYQIQEEKTKLLRQEDMIRTRQMERLKQVRAEKALLEKQEQMLKLREEQLLLERKRQEKLREEANKLKRQEEEIRRRQEEITKELMRADIDLSDDVLVGHQPCTSQMFPGPSSSGPGNGGSGFRRPYVDNMLDSSIVNVQPLSTSDWSSSDAESLMVPQGHHQGLWPGRSGPQQQPPAAVPPTHDTTMSMYQAAGSDYDQPVEGANIDAGEETSEDEDTMEEDCYECKVEVKQQNTKVPTSVRTIETVIDVPGWAPITPYLNVSKSLPATTHEEMSSIFSDSRMMTTYKTAGIITSPDSIITSTNLQTTPDSSMSIQSQFSMNEDHSIDSSSCPGSPLPPSLPPPPRQAQDLMPEHFNTIQPDVPPREDSFAVFNTVCTAGHVTNPLLGLTQSSPQQQLQQRNLVDVDNCMSLMIPIPTDLQHSPRLGGPGSAFRPYASNENLFEPSASMALAAKPPIMNGKQSEKGKGVAGPTTKVTAHKGFESDEDFFKPRAPRMLKAPIMSTTDTEPEMKEFNLGPIGGEKKGKKQQKIFYSTSETEEEYQAYLKSKPKWHGKGGHKDSWDPMQIASPPQIVQKPVGIVQKPKPQAKVAPRIERGAQMMDEAVLGGQVGLNEPEKTVLGPEIMGHTAQSPPRIEISNSNAGNNSLAPPKFERIQKSDSIIELRKTSSTSVPNMERVQKSTSVIEVVPKVPPLPVQETLLEGSAVSSGSLTGPRPELTVGMPSAPQQASAISLTVSSPPDSEDQTTPQAPRKMLPHQHSMESSTSYSENEESLENLAPQLKSLKEDPETKKKKEIHKNLMNEALKKVELRNNQKKMFSQLSRTNPTIAALGIVTRKELKMEELENRQDQEYLRQQQTKPAIVDEGAAQPAQSAAASAAGQSGSGGVNSNVLQSYRMQSIQKGGRSAQNSSSREAEIQARKAGCDLNQKPEILPKPDVKVPPPASEATVVLKKQPRILDEDELKARQKEGQSLDSVTSARPKSAAAEVTSSSASRRISSTEARLDMEAKKNSDDPSAVVRQPPSQKQKEDSAVRQSVPDKTNNNSVKDTNSNKKEIAGDREVQAGKQQTIPSQHGIVDASQKVMAAHERLKKEQQQQAQKAESVKHSMADMVQARPKSTIEAAAAATSDKEDKDQPKGVMVKKAAEKFEISVQESNNYQSEPFPPSSSLQSGVKNRSRSIGHAIREQLKDTFPNNNSAKVNLPWAGKSSPIHRKRDMRRGGKGYALQMSKSSDSITAAKMLAQARQEEAAADSVRRRGLRGIGGGTLQINRDMSKSMEQQMDIYSKTKEEIQLILSLAKSGSVNDRIKLFSNMMNSKPETPDPNEKAEKIRREIEDARCQAPPETVSDTEIEFQEPVESKVKPLKIPMKPKLLASVNNGKGAPANSPRGGPMLDNDREKAIAKSMQTAKSKMNSQSSDLEDEGSMSNSNKFAARRPSKERSKSPRKKVPKPVSDQFLSPDTSFKIYTQSATDMSATEDESESRPAGAVGRKSAPINKSELGPPILRSSDLGPAGPHLLSVPAKSVTEIKSGLLTKSKSFASPGQFSASLDENEITSKKQTMMAFFGFQGRGQAGQQQPVAKSQGLGRAQRRSSLSSITDEILEEEDLVDIDAEFESLLNKTFEADSKRVDKQQGGMSRAAASTDNANKIQKSKSFHSDFRRNMPVAGGPEPDWGGGPQSGVAALQRGGPAAKQYSAPEYQPMTASSMQPGKSILKQPSTTLFPVRTATDSADGGVRYSPPVSPLGGHTASPSPTQSEYDTCDPWDET